MIARAPEWTDACPDKCEECGHRICETPGTGIYLPGLADQEIMECPRKTLESNPQELQAASAAIRAWRHWTKGNLAAFAPDASEALGTLVLVVDDEVAAYQDFKHDRAMAEAERKAKAQQR